MWQILGCYNVFDARISLIWAVIDNHLKVLIEREIA